MSDKFKVTIGLCVKNVEATINEAIDGILSQTYPHQLMELVVVDGFSEDRTLMLIKKKLADKDIVSSFYKENTGLGMARQMVVEKARGDYIVWVDGDIILSPDYIKNQVEYMENNPQVAAAGGKYGVCSGKSFVSKMENIVVVVESEYGMPATSNLGQLPGTEGSIYRVEAIRVVNGFDVSIKGAAEDLDAAYRMKEAGWSLSVTNELFQEACRETWLSLWDQYFWYGYGAHFIFNKKKGSIELHKMVPIAGFLAGVIHSIRAYKITNKKFFFLLPIHYTFKRIAWCFGFAKAYIDGYKT